ncbi:spermidine dehydrogenase SpdH [Sphaerisporangium melleum]|uniref:Spermidine dehydrogenase SpdH n=1 Tax=Sphaerisporangium melleum TaxID=321316 RepID=A0A917QXI8_9ACTN|nr:NAD(P)/FAD-dependent oxidoreductase [Sphaerisporangium melleum]GGK73867.1 spermidine dehydrogenase SpdH [Sphaerisporangium melleum]GII70840.1 spermidine dehydrogenase SpdH [Sphaerisporangium melleum]
MTAAVAYAALASPAVPFLAAVPSGPPSASVRSLLRERRARHSASVPGLRGDTPDALGVAQALRDGRFWRHADPPRPAGETYDLVVVGAGISGVTAAYLYTRRHPQARVLILDGNDDIGGHARSAEFRPAGRRGPLVASAGPYALHAPAAWPAEARDLLADLGARPERLRAYADPGLYPGLGMREGVFCDRETYGPGADRLVRLPPGGDAAGWVAELPIAERARHDLAMLYDDPPDWFPGLPDEEKKRRLAGLTYEDFLREVCRVHPDAVAFCRTMPAAAFGHGAGALTALDAWNLAGGHSYPGFAGLGLGRSRPHPGNSARVAVRWAGGDEVYCLPEGPQALVRMMLGRMVPGFAATTAPDRITTASFDHGALDRPGSAVRVRLSSPVVLVDDDGAAGSATVGYFDGHRVITVRAGAVIMACRAAAVPDLVRDLPSDQREALRRTVRMPVVCATAQLRNWHAFLAARVHRVRFTGAYWTEAALAPPVGSGGYDCPRRPGEPIAVHLTHAPAPSGLPPADAAEAGRRALAGTPYAAMEFAVREQLARLLGPFGFDAARDVEGLTVHRWEHGFAREEGPRSDTARLAETAARRFGRVAIAGVDVAPGGDVRAAITAACRAVRDLS